MDHRNFAAGAPLPREGYCDQPYVVRTGDGAGLAVGAALRPGGAACAGQELMQ